MKQANSNQNNSFMQKKMTAELKWRILERKKPLLRGVREVPNIRITSPQFPDIPKKDLKQ